MSKLKDLYLASSIEGLSKMVEVPEAFKKKNIGLILKSADQLEESINQRFAEGDEELGYVYLMKYFTLMRWVQDKPDYQRQKGNVKNAMGGNSGWSKKMDLLESTQKNLRRRYAELNKSSDKTAQIPAVEENSVSVSSTYITCENLYEKLINESISMLIMDCRPSEEFSKSHIEYKYCANIPEELVQKGLSAEMLFRRLPPDSHDVWGLRVEKSFLILMDNNTREKSPMRNTSIDILRDILLQWDQDNVFDDTRHLLILEGGYENFALLYPMHVTNPGWKKPVDLHMSINLDDIQYGEEYTSIDQIKMKDLNLSIIPTKGKPIINRSTKPGALPKYTNEHPAEILLKQKAKMVDDLYEVTINRSRKIFEESALIQKIDLIENSNSTEQTEFHDHLRKISFDIFELEDLLTNIVKQIHEIDREIEEYPMNQNLLPLEMSVKQKIEEIKALEAKCQLKHSENNRKKEMVELREKKRRYEDQNREKQAMKEERERKIAAATAAAEEIRLAKEAKEKQTKAAQDEQFARTVRMPLIDRTNKPKSITVPKLISERNFYPEPGSEGPGLTGLKNLGNTCYMNSIIQCLMNIDCLAEYLTKETYLKHIDRNSKTNGQIVEELAAVASEIWSGRYRNISPRDLRYVIGEFKSAFAGYEQQDSHEFLTIFMDLLHLELQTIYEKSLTPKEKLRDSERAWLEFTKQKESFFSKIFFGQIKSMVKCTVCGIESSTYESFSNLSLELPQNNSQCDLKDCLDLYFDGERVSDWNCPRCGQKRDAIKKLDISKLPPVLVIHFKRFYADYDSSKFAYKKKQTTIDFPLNNFNMSEYLSPVERKMNHSTVYNLCSVSNHYGTMERGHYTAYCKNARKNRWYKFDDHVVTPMDSDQVVSHAAYILFYSTL